MFAQYRVTLIVLLTAAVALVARGQEPQKSGARNAAPGQDQAKPMELKTKAQKADLALSVNFGEALGLPFDSLATLGSRIDAARKIADPVALSALASELSIAEKVAGKQASLTSKSLASEAMTLAEGRRIPAELRAVALGLVDDAAKRKLQTLADTADKEQQEISDMVKGGEKPRELHGTLEVTNLTHHAVRIYVSGRYYGTVGAHGHRHFLVHDSSHFTSLHARDVYGHLSWHETLHGDHHHYDWTLTE